MQAKTTFLTLSATSPAFQLLKNRPVQDFWTRLKYIWFAFVYCGILKSHSQLQLRHFAAPSCQCVHAPHDLQSFWQRLGYIYTTKHPA